MLQRSAIFLLTLLIGFAAFSQQDSIRNVEIEGITISDKKAGFKRIGLYDEAEDEEPNVRGFTQLVIFEKDLTDEFWTSPKGEKCITAKKAGDNLNLVWNKDQAGCDWVGMGFGWDQWTGKDMGYVADTLAIELVVRSTGHPFTNIPWAFGIEDYGGAQAWLGYNRSFLKAEAITTEWTKVHIPLPAFPFEEFDVDLTNIKQLLIQVFASGEIEIQTVRLVPFNWKPKQEAVATPGADLAVDGDLKEWVGDFIAFGDGHAFAVRYSESAIDFAFKIKDDTPRQNVQKKQDLWNGDAIEIAISTNPNANPKRNFLFLSDQHVGLNCGANPYLWDWKAESEIKDAAFAFQNTDGGYHVEISLPTGVFPNFKPEKGMHLDFEIAVDLNGGDSRKAQQRWNSTFEEGFHLSPKKWGKLILE